MAQKKVSTMATAKTAREFKAQIKNDWPHDLKQLAHNALNSLKVMARPDNRDDRLRAAHKAALAAFDHAYAEWRK